MDHTCWFPLSLTVQCDDVIVPAPFCRCSCRSCFSTRVASYNSSPCKQPHIQWSSGYRPATTDRRPAIQLHPKFLAVLSFYRRTRVKRPQQRLLIIPNLFLNLRQHFRSLLTSRYSRCFVCCFSC